LSQCTVCHTRKRGSIATVTYYTEV
jgi:hypothetical protein